MIPKICIIAGGVSAEREVSLKTGQALLRAMPETLEVELLDLQEACVPESINASSTVVCNALHGTFGEDGTFQQLLEERGIAYTGCDARASALCMDKAACKQAVSYAGVPIAKGITFSADEHPQASALIAELGESLVLKPQSEGSSVGLHMCEGLAELQAAIDTCVRGNWLCEQRIRGREFSVGILEGKALAVVEIIPEGGVYDFSHKYTAGATRYVCPAEISPALAGQLMAYAEQAFAACGCRDFARADFLADSLGRAVFLELNTLPGMTETSLLPKTAAAAGLNFNMLVERLLQPAIQRFHAQQLTADAVELAAS